MSAAWQSLVRLSLQRKLLISLLLAAMAVGLPSYQQLHNARQQNLLEESHQVLLLTGLLLLALLLMARLIVQDLGQGRRALVHRARLLDHAEELAQLGCAETDLMSDTVRWTAGMARLFGEPWTDAPLDPDWLYLRVPRGERERVDRHCRAVTPQQPCEFQHRIIRADGSLRTVLHRAIIEVDDKGWPRRSLTLLQDITQQRDVEQRVQLLANCCPVTGLFNRSALLERLQAVQSRCQAEQRGLAVLALQLEQLGMVMDSLGYEGGDRLLQIISQRLSEQAGNRGVLAHLGLGEFVLLLETPAVGPEQQEQALQQAKDLCERLARPLELGEAQLQPSCAAGLCLSSGENDAPQRLLHQAQAALKRARELDDHQVCIYDPEHHVRAVSRLGLEAGLRRALATEGLSLAFQPQLELSRGKVCGAEVLLRWVDPVRGPISPVEFIPIAEESGLILELGEWVLRQACIQHMAWQDQGLPGVRLAVNLSARQLQQPDIAWRIQNVLRETGMDPRYLGLEITESIFVDESPHLVRALGALKALGVEISLDDFGTGYSNLGYLRKLPIDVVKIDRSIVHDVAAAAHDVSMTRAVINMAHSLQMRVLAEGVETEGQLALLMAHSCNQMQGFYFSRPLAAEDFAALLREGRCLPEQLFRRERERTLLLVDDEDNIVSSLRRLLRRDGYHIVTASNGAEGLQKLAEHNVDVIISDQRMPGMTGVEFLRRAKELYPATVRMVLSGYTELQSVTDAINEGAIYKFLTKPWDDERLRAHVEEAFRRKELSDENQRLSTAVSEMNQELAEVNRRLQQLLQSQAEQIGREGASLQLLRELLECIPIPMIGGDNDGLISYINEQAESIFPHQSPLGQQAEDVLPEGLQTLWRGQNGNAAHVQLREQGFHALYRSLKGGAVDPAGRSTSRGWLLLLMPEQQSMERV
ncbi:diguanylate cyclase (GGDEF)-like protein [Paucibacter oligotrophus]|uniref:Diguanylate cyclase (GGDEF)-like protein n=1 Tax=Roseateles oligotrophus TaxID=1769250 RepID=A0A840LAQ3_9BURK|nr:EAL domain-containing protein [Roseateles oligotrophus]MBB4844821.1 diguanylate cyclase (GGDEF)-like protein [Roseateles oligotrophus]